VKIAAVDAFALRVPNPAGQTYWGSQAWASGTASPGVAADAGRAAWEEYPPRWRMRATYSSTINTVVVRITVDNGLVGFGEAKAPVTPEATRDVIEKEIPGIGEAMRQESLKKVRTAMLSRGTAGTRGKTLIVNLPGSPKGARENLAVLTAILEHTVEKIKKRDA